MLRWFKCPDGQLTEAKECMSGVCRLGMRCAPLAYLRKCGAEREWKGTPSTTQLQNGTREAYLKITQDYAIDPQQRVWAILGTNAHGYLEEHSDTGKAETQMFVDDTSGTCDEIEKQPNGETWMIDYKTSGSFKAKKIVGLTLDRVEKLYDSDGVPVMDKKGKQREVKFFKLDPANADFGDYLYQLNRYRVMAKKTFDITIDRMMIMCFVRDGGLQMTVASGLENNFYYVEVPFVDDEVIEKYFNDKRDALLKALEEKKMPPVCSPTECWDGGKCEKYCEVKGFCTNNPYLK